MAQKLTKADIEKIYKTPGQVLSYETGSEDDEQHFKELSKNFPKFFLSKDQQKFKEQVLFELEQIVNEWSDTISQERNISRELFGSYRARLLTYGSYLLGVSSQSGDIDIVIVSPHNVDRVNHFQNLLHSKFQSNANIQGCKYIQSNIAPIITFQYKNQPIDINLAILEQDTVPKYIDEDIPDHFLENIDKQDKNALNGRRNNQDILKSVKRKRDDKIIHENQEQVFRDTLRCIKLWHKAWGLSTNRLGYFGGINIAIMVAKIVQMFPNLNAIRTLEQFFKVYSSWDWQIPVKIKEETLKEYIPTYHMAIISPASPNINTMKATLTNLLVIKDLIGQTHNLIQNSINNGTKKWSQIFEPYSFFDIYHKFIQIDIVGKQQADEEEFNSWKDICEVKMLQLYKGFERVEGFNFHPYPSAFGKKKSVKSEIKYSEAYFIGVKMNKNQQPQQPVSKAQQKAKKLKVKNEIKKSFIEEILKLDQYRKSKGVVTVNIFQTEQKEIIEDINFGDLVPKYQNKRNNPFEDKKDFGAQKKIKVTTNQNNSNIDAGDEFL